jgi:Ni/Co efflux regulator RcnB
MKRSFNPLPPFFVQAHIHSSIIYTNTQSRVTVYTSVLVILIQYTMSSGKKLETTMEFVQRLTREASERQEALEMEKTGEIGKEEKEEKEEKEKEKEEKEAEGKKRKWESGIKVSERYNEEDADITIISSDGVSFKVHSLFLVRASYVPLSLNIETS